MKFCVKIEAGQELPPFYGIGKNDFSERAVYAYPMPLNLFVMLYYEWVRFWKNPRQMNRSGRSC